MLASVELILFSLFSCLNTNVAGEVTPFQHDQCGSKTVVEQSTEGLKFLHK
jgi:hypothetical protein